MDFAKVTILKPSAALLFGLLLLTDVVAIAQSLLTKEEVAAIDQAELTNQEKLSHYTWLETRFILLNGEAIDYRLYSVSSGTNGRYRRNLVTEDTGQEATFEPSTKEQLSPYGPYAQQLCDLAKQCTTLSSEQLTRADYRGEGAVLREDGSIELAIKNYLKPGDSVAMTINPRTHRPLGVRAKSYLADPQDVVTIHAECAELPDGTDYVATADIDSVGRHLTVKLKNWSYSY